MHLHKLSLVNFKNYPESELFFDDGANAFVGGNGEGKTNLLDAIHYLSMSKSSFNPIDGQNILHGEDFFMIQGIFELDGKDENIYCGLKRNQKKILKRNNKEYEKLADHIGLIPVVMISPADTGLISQGSEERRRFIDIIISQYDKLYLDDLISYSRVLSQRNAYLKQSSYSISFDENVLAAWDIQMVRLAEKIFRIRTEFVSNLKPVFRNYYKYISGGREEVDMRYDSQLTENNFSELLLSVREKDRALQYSTAGIHKDELHFTIDGYPVKRYGSQGQQKSFLVSLKLSQFDFIREIKKYKPILLLDDIFDKLDDQRVARLMELVSKHNFGQLFITDSHPERIQNIFNTIGIGLKCFKVKKGTVVNENVSV